jgi:hypothetical protein
MPLSTETLFDGNSVINREVAMQLASFATRKWCRSFATCLLVVGLVLGLADSTRAQSAGAKSAPIAIRNNTDTALTIHIRSIENDYGTYRPTNLSMVVAPGEYRYLVDANNSKVFAKRYEYAVNTQGRSSQWTATLSSSDANGYFDISFSPMHLRVHLGEQAATPATPLAPPPVQQSPSYYSGPPGVMPPEQALDSHAVDIFLLLRAAGRDAAPRR